MAFRGQRFHDSMPFADSTSQDMDFWRQRCKLETQRSATPSSFGTQQLESLPRNPFKDSAGMLFGRGVSPRIGESPLGALAPDLAAYRASVPNSPLRPSAPNGSIPHPFWQIPRTQVLGTGGSPEERAARGASRLNTPHLAPTRAPVSFERQLHYEQPHTRIAAPIRMVQPRARLDARMYSASPG